MKKLRSIFPNLLFGIAIFGFSFFSYLLRAFMVNIDEFDHIAAGYLMSLGYRPYLDFFAHHFPLPYWWVNLFSHFWVNLSPARALTVFRLSLSLLYLLSFVLEFSVLKNPKSKIAFSLWILSIPFFFSIYHGNLMLSETFVAIFLSGIFWILVPSFLGWEKITNKKLILLFWWANCCFWTQPSLFFLVLLPFVFFAGKRKILFLAFSFLFCLPILILLAGDNLKDFWEQAVVFNICTYSNLFPEKVDSRSFLGQTIFSFLENERKLLVNFSGDIGFSQFIAHFCFLVLFLWLVWSAYRRRDWRGIFSVFCLVLAVRIREVKIIPGSWFNFGIYPLIFISSASIVCLIFLKPKIFRISGFLLFLAFLFFSAKMSVPIFIQSLRPGYNYHVFWSYRQENGEVIRKLSLPEEKILIYPHDVDLYFWARRRPIDRFVYWFPWINSVERYRKERLEALKNTPPSVIYVGNLAYKEDPNLYATYFPNLTSNYYRVLKKGKKTNIWIRKDLINRLGDDLAISEDF